jgi:PAS domain S-box-containing protein
MYSTPESLRTEKLGWNPKRILVLYLLAGILWLVILMAWQYLLPNMPFIGSLITGLIFLAASAVVLGGSLQQIYKSSLQRQQSFRKVEDRFELMFDQSPQPMWVCDINDNRLLNLNAAALELFGFSLEELENQPLERLILEKDQYLLNLHLRPDLEYEKAGIWRFLNKNHEVIYLDLAIHQMVSRDKLVKLVIATNLTELIKTQEEKLRINNELYHYKRALDRSAMLCITDLNGEIVDVNNKFCKISGYHRGELLDYNARILNSGHHPKSFWRDMFSTLGQGQVWRREIRNRAKDGRLFWVDMSIVPVYDENNQIQRYMGIAYPVTDRKVAELKSEKVHKELMTFMYKASHNLRGPVATLSGLLNVAKMEVQDSNSARYIDLMTERASHLEFTLSELIAITNVKQEELSVSEISFCHIIEEVLQSFQPKLELYNIKVEKSVSVEKSFFTDEKLVRGILFYLTDNAIKFRDNDEPAISIEVKDQSQGVLLSVSDNGPGIEPEIQDRIYDMYYRGHEKSQGSGLGLYIVASIVERLMGYITLDSSPERGTTFRIFLPNDLYMRKKMNERELMYLRNEN